MLWPDCSVVHVAPEVAKARHWWSVTPRCESDAGDEPSTVDLTPITAVDKPLVLLLVEFGTIYVLVILHMLLDVPLLLDMLEVAPKLWPAGVSFFKGEIFPKLFIEELINGRIAVDSGTRIAVPMLHTSARTVKTKTTSLAYPNTATRATLLVY